MVYRLAMADHLFDWYFVWEFEKHQSEIITARD